MTSSRAVRRSLLFLVVGAASLLWGCSGGETYSVRPGNLGHRYLPSKRSVSHSPDSLVDVSIEEEEEHVTVDLKRGYESLHRKWSCTYESLSAGRSRPGRSYATFWSLELSLASLQPEVGLNTLSREQAKKALEDRRGQYRSTIEIDVYWFAGEGETILTGPGSRAELRVNGERYRPASEGHGPLREAFLPGSGSTALYRRNTFHFKRNVQKKDILADADEMNLVINRPGSASRVRFVWSWERGKTASTD